MTLRVRETALPGVLVIEPPVTSDHRGSFLEAWRRSRYVGIGLPADFVQDNVSQSVGGTLRGLHFQEPFAQGKLVQVFDGEIFDVAVDIRLGSPTFGRWAGERLSAANHRQLYVPPGFAHGFCVVSDMALVAYKCTAYYRPDTELTIAWNDPEIGIGWPVGSPMLSPRDAAAPPLSAVPRERLPELLCAGEVDHALVVATLWRYWHDFAASGKGRG